MRRSEQALDYERLLSHEDYRWILQEGLPVILSPDLDGLLSGLLGAHHLGWQVKGFYDGKTLVTGEPLSYAGEVVFIDMEVYRPNVCSIGNHLLQWAADLPLPGFRKTLNPNLLRGITVEQFSRKYPFGTFHFLALLLAFGGVQLDFQGVQRSLFLYPDSTLFNLLNYGANCKDWIGWLAVSKAPEPVRRSFNVLRSLPLSKVMHEFQGLLQALRSIGLGPGPRGMQRGITNEGQARKAWTLLQEWTGWQAPPLPAWRVTQPFEFFSVFANRRNYVSMLNSSPFSFAITSQGKGGLRYTLVPDPLRRFAG